MASPYSSNPFESPAVVDAAPPPATSAGALDPAAALRGGLAALQAAPGVVLGVVALAVVVHAVGALVWLGPLLLTPVLTWGLTRFALDASRGHATYDALWSGFSRFGEAWVGMFVVMLVAGFALAPGVFMLVVAVGLWMFDLGTQGSAQQSSVQLLAFGGAVFASWVTVVFPRLALAPFLVVDRGLSGWDAVRVSWRAMRGQALRGAALGVAGTLLFVGGLLAFGVGVIPAVALVLLALASAYRQLFGDDPSAPLG
jgi:hypothetical protein